MIKNTVTTRINKREKKDSNTPFARVWEIGTLSHCWWESKMG
jgi:hypothetical protein